jgi:Big-like domain-containing protein
MKFQKTPIAVAAFALFAAATSSALAAPSVAFKKPDAGATLSNVSISQTAACEVTGTNIKRVAFSMVSASGATTALNTEFTAPWNCNINSKNFADGAYTLKAVAYDSANASATATRSITVKNNTATNTPPTVSLTSPANGASVSGTAVSCAANASDTNGIKQVQFFLDSTALSTDTASPYTCSFDSTKFTNGAHTLKAVATDGLNATSTTQISVNVNNSTPPTTNPVPVVTFTKPANGATVPATSVACEVTAVDTDGIKQLQWYYDGKLVNTELKAPYDTCNINSLTPGAHVIKAVATDNKGGIGEAQITVNVGSTGGGGTTNTPPTVSLTSPSSGATLTGTAAGYAATASDTGGSVAKVDFYLTPAAAAAASSAAAPAPIATKTTAPYQGTFDSTKYANGPYTMLAVATDNLGATSQSQTSVTVNNVVNPGGGGGGGGTGTTLPSTNAKAIATFESLGLYWTPTSNPGAGCDVRYRKTADADWKQGLQMWYDSRNNECRGSLVHLTPGTDYVVEMGLPGQAPVVGLNTKTWSESFPIAKTVQVQSGSQTLKITEGGTASGYVLYTGPATLDAANAVDYNIQISAPYVIVRGLTLKGAKVDAIRLEQGTKDVVIEDNDISGWGRDSGNVSSEGWKIGVNRDSAVSAFCRAGPWLERTIIQRNKIHDPRYGSNSWSDGHPSGPNGVLFSQCGGNHVFRFNEVYSSTGHYFMDAFGGEENFSDIGFPNADTDINGNKISNTWDDGIESEGANRNVRIWGNYIDSTAVAIATTVTHVGPAYIFRNVYNRSRMMSMKTLDNDERNNAFKSGTDATYGKGRRYVFHNTLLQATQAGVVNPLGAGGGLSAGGTGALTNTVSRNNILHIWKGWWQSVNTQGGASNDLDYDLHNGSVSAYAGAETNGILGTPIYASGNGWQSESNGMYQLAPNSPGYDRGIRLPNFNDGYGGAGPDMGAHEAGMPAMQFGLTGAGAVWPSGSAPVAATTSGSTSTGGATSGTGTTSGTTTTTTDSGVCSTLVCAAQ